MKVASLQTTEYFARVHDWFGMIPKETTLTFSNPRRQLASNAHELEEVTSYIRTYAPWASMNKCFQKFSNTSLMFNKIMEEIRMLSMGSTTIHPGFHTNGIPQLCEQGDSIGQTQRCNGVCSRDQPRVRQHYEHRWFWLGLRIAHTQIKVWTRQ